MKTKKKSNRKQKPLNRVEQLLKDTEEHNAKYPCSPEFQAKLDRLFSKPVIVVSTSIKDMPTQAKDMYSKQE